MAQDARKYKQPVPVIPGRHWDTQVGGEDTNDRRIYAIVRQLQTSKAELGKTNVAAIPALNDVLVWNGVAWVNIPKRNLLAMDDLTDATITTPVLGAFLVYDGANWVNQNFTPARLGVGTALNPTHRFELADDVCTSWFEGAVSSPKSGGRGWRFSKAKTSGIPLSQDWCSDGAPCWGNGMDFDTNNSLNSGFGNADFVLLYDYSAGKKDDGTGLGDGADLFRVSPAEASADGYNRWIISSRAGSPNTGGSVFFTLEAGLGLSAMNVSANNATAGKSHLTLTQRQASTNWSMISYNNKIRIGCDPLNANKATWCIIDDVAGQYRLFIDDAGRIRLDNNTAPTAFLHLRAGVAAASGAPLKFVSGTNLTTPEAGAVEYDGTEWYFTRASTRLKVLLSTPVDGTDIVLGTVTGMKIGTANNQKLAFLGGTPQAVPAAYTLTGSATRTFPTDPSSAYTGIDNAQGGTPYAKVADLETLRGVVSSILGVMRQEHVDINGYGLLQ